MAKGLIKKKLHSYITETRWMKLPFSDALCLLIKSLFKCSLALSIWKHSAHNLFKEPCYLFPSDCFNVITINILADLENIV